MGNHPGVPGVPVIFLNALHHCDCMWADFKSISSWLEGFSPGSLVLPGIRFAGTHLCTWVERGTALCLAQEHFLGKDTEKKVQKVGLSRVAVSCIRWDWAFASQNLKFTGQNVRWQALICRHAWQFTRCLWSFQAETGNVFFKFLWLFSPSFYQFWNKLAVTRSISSANFGFHWSHLELGS